MTIQVSQTTRRHDLDWLRVITIITVFIFHTGRFFDEGGWHVKNLIQTEGFQDLTDLLVIWIMPIMFVISGAAIHYGFKKEQIGKFLKDKVLRLLVPTGRGYVYPLDLAGLPGCPDQRIVLRVLSLPSSPIILKASSDLEEISPSQPFTCGTWKFCSYSAFYSCRSLSG